MGIKRIQGEGDEPVPVVTRKIAAQAATWIARLHGPDRSAQMEQDVREWLARSAAHRLAFERCTDVWQEVAGVSVADAYESAATRVLKSAAARERWWARLRWPLWGLLTLLIGGAGFLALQHRNAVDYETKIGEQQLVVMEDGSRMSLNTDTRIRVTMGASRRLVELKSGEALFEVARDPNRPFVVRVADSEVVALGTTFSVRLPGSSSEHRNDALSVLLLEGKISVRPAAGTGEGSAASGQAVQMQAGERMLLTQVAGKQSLPVVQQLDGPRMEQMVAWKRGEAVFDDAALSEAVTEMNRYTRTPIVLVGDASRLRVSGLYHTGDGPGFARAVAALHGLKVQERSGRLELTSPQ